MIHGIDIDLARARAAELSPHERAALLALPLGTAEVMGPWPHADVKPVRAESRAQAFALWDLAAARHPLVDDVLRLEGNEVWKCRGWVLTREGVAASLILRGEG